jgi:hypothetical protein
VRVFRLGVGPGAALAFVGQGHLSC